MKYLKLAVSDMVLSDLICSDHILNVAIGIQHLGKRNFLFCLSKIIYFCKRNSV